MELNKGKVEDRPNDLSPLWIKEAYKQELQKIGNLSNSYNSLKDKNTHYAEGIAKVMSIRKQIAEIWKKEL